MHIQLCVYKLKMKIELTTNSHNEFVKTPKNLQLSFILAEYFRNLHSSTLLILKDTFKAFDDFKNKQQKCMK